MPVNLLPRVPDSVFALVPRVRAYELTKAKMERKEGSGVLRTKSSSVHHSRDHAIVDLRFGAFPRYFQLREAIDFHICLHHCCRTLYVIIVNK